jgi:hypothetical protein
VFHHIVWRAITGDGDPQSRIQPPVDLGGPLSISGSPKRLSRVNSHAITITEGTMKYLCLIYYDEQKLDALSKRELDALIDEALAYDEVLRKSGHYLVSNALQSVQTATTLRVRNSKVSMTDGPFAETKEQLGGFILIDARDLDDAIQVASKIPPARLGSVEVRPIWELKQP